MASPIVPFYGKDSDRLAKLSLAYKIMLESESFLKNWPSTVATVDLFKQRIDVYERAFQKAAHGDRREIAQRIAAGNIAGATWQKMVNYACSTEEDHTTMLEQMGVVQKVRRSGSVSHDVELYPPELVVANLEQKGAVRAACSRERRRYTYEIYVTEGDPRVEEGWYHRASFGDCAKMDMDGYHSGKEYSFRCRIIGRDNKIGPWSHTITLMVT